VLFRSRGTPILEDTAHVLAGDMGVTRVSAELAIEAAKSKSVNVIYALPTHPGHHAGSHCYGGYCFLNNVVLGAQLVTPHLRPAILDVDYHAGDGSWQLLRKSNIPFQSIHSLNDYPYVANAFVPGKCLDRNSSFDDYSKALDEVLARYPQNEIDVLFVSLGVDTLNTDPEARDGMAIGLEVPHYKLLAQQIRKTFGDKLIVVFQEGGYDIEQVPLAVRSFLEGCAL